MADIKGDHDIQGNGAVAALPPAVRRNELPDFAPDLAGDEPDPNDTTSILRGAAAVTGKAGRSAMRMDSDPGVFALYDRERKKIEERRSNEARELARLAQWNAETVVVGGVSMTNGEAQEARRRVAANDSAYADWAVRNGHIREDEKEAFRAAIRRKIELEEKRGRGTMTEAEAREEQELDRSRAGHAIDAATASNHVTYAQTAEAAMTAGAGNSNLRSASQALPAGDVFQADLSLPAAAPTASREIAPRVKATGLTL